MRKLDFSDISNPILIIGDAPEQLTGLARIGRDLASLLCQLPQFRVAYLGRGATGRAKFPWTQYSYPALGQWGEEYIEPVWKDFSAGQPGVIFSTWDASRMQWFGHPQTTPGTLGKFLGEGRNFYKWGYFPVDGEGPRPGSLPAGIVAAISGYDRVLVPSEWADQLVSFHPSHDWIPHGYDSRCFNFTPERTRTDRQALDWADTDIVVGCNMANQSRKDWATAFETAAHLKRNYGNAFRFWAHTDTIVRDWNLVALAVDYGVNDCTEVTTGATDHQLAQRYGACDCTMLPSTAEGFGYPPVESQACGTPCVVPAIGPLNETCVTDCCVNPVFYRLSTIHNVTRAVLSGYAFANCIVQQVDRIRSEGDDRRAEVADHVQYLRWDKLLPVWKRWFLGGLQ